MMIAMRVAREVLLAVCKTRTCVGFELAGARWMETKERGGVVFILRHEFVLVEQFSSCSGTEEHRQEPGA